MAGVTFSGVTKRFGVATVVRNLDLEVRDHEFMVLVGPSGCGKSTALRMVAGLEEISEGTIRIGERVVNDLAPKDRDIAMVFQSYALYPHMTVRENLGFGLKIRGLGRDEVERRVGDAARLLEIDGLLDRRPRELSGGQRQRVAVGRAIVRQPAVFLFDEPLSNLDAKLRVQMRAEISKLQRRLDATTIYVTHDQVEAMTMGHRVAVLKDGQLQQVGTPLELYDRPGSAFVAGFLGTPPMNLFAAGVFPGGERIVAAGFELPLPPVLRGAAAGASGRRVVVGIRPEHVSVGAESIGEDVARVPGEVEIAEPLGHEVVVHARVGRELIVAKMPPRAFPRLGERVTLSIRLDALHLFDAESERRLGP